MKKRMMICSLLLAGLLLFAGCNTKSPQKLLEQSMQQISQAKYLDATIEGEISIDGEETDDAPWGINSVNFDMDLKLDNSKDTPVVDLEGKLGASFVQLDVHFFLNDSIAYISAMGEEDTTELDEDFWENYRKAMKEYSESEKDSDLYKVEKSFEDKNTVLTVTYDLDKINEMLREEMGKNTAYHVDQMTLVYVLDTKDTLKEVRAELKVNSAGYLSDESMEFKVTMTIHSIDQKLDILVPASADMSELSV